MKFLDRVKALVAVLKGGESVPSLDSTRRDRLASIMGATPEDIGAAMRQTLRGDQEGFAKLCAIYEHYVRNEPRLRAVVEKRRRKVIGWPWEIKPADDSAQAKADADFLRGVYRGIPRFRRTVLWELTDAIGKGVAAVQLTGGLKDGKLVIAKAAGLPTWSIRHPFDLLTGLPDYERWEGNDARTLGLWQPVPEGKLLVYSREEQGSYFTAGLMWPTVWYACFKNFTIKDWLAFIEVYGVPMRIGKVPPEYKPGSREWETVRMAVENAPSDSGAVISKDADLTVMDGMKGASSVSFESAAKYFDGGLAELWLGGTLTTSAGDVGSQSLGNVHLDEEYALTIPDSEDLAETLTEFGSYLIAANFGERKAYPVFDFDTRLPKDITKQSAAIVPILQLGVPVDLDGLYEEFMPWGKPSGGEIFVAKNAVPFGAGASPTSPTSPTGQAGLSAALAGNPGTPFQGSPPPEAGPGVPAFSAFPGADLVDGLASSGAALVRMAYEALIDALDESGDAAPEALLAFRQAVRDALAPLIAAGRLAGAVHQADEVKAFDARADARRVVSEATMALAQIPAALAAIDLSGPSPVLPRDESGRVIWSRVQPKEAMDWWARRAAATPQTLDALEESARARAFTISGVESQKIIDTAHAEIGRAISEGTTAADFKKGMKAAGWGADASRIEQVFNQNLASAYGAGREAALNSEAVKKYLPNSQLHTMGDSDVRPEHQRLNGIVMRTDDPGRPPAPLYYGCRCFWTAAAPGAPLTDPASIVWPAEMWGPR